MRAFLEVAERGSFARAATHLRVTSSALSQTIQRLEKRLGVRLLQRTTRSVGVTAAGEELACRLRPAMSGFDEALDSLNEFRDTPVGTVRLTVSRVGSELVVEPRIAALRQRYPRVRLEVSVDDRLVDVVARRFDAGIRRRHLVESEMVAQQIAADDQLVAVASPSYLRQHRAPSRPGELRLHAGICIRRGKSEAIPTRSFVSGSATDEVDITPALLVDDAHLARHAAVTGAGVAFLAAAYLEDALATGALVRLLPEWSCPVAGLCLFYPSRHHVPAPLRALVEVLRPAPTLATSTRPPPRRRRTGGSSSDPRR